MLLLEASVVTNRTIRGPRDGTSCVLVSKFGCRQNVREDTLHQRETVLSALRPHRVLKGLLSVRGA